ncbi:MAG: 23S rRNA (adenine(2503)-C(2))-methyltransferase RlmN [Candidatus Gastranaerophilales bacterium]|nr:23S rRNA (adenine(2503)-C(2))-methyltransferase RlmN [Candidatus Gastranaerophilales bacterium]
MINTDQKVILSGMNLCELEKLAKTLDEPIFRAKQLHSWLYKKCVSEFDQMTNLSKDFRAKLNEVAQISDTKIKQRLISSDGTIKYLLEFSDGSSVETVLMRFDNRPNLTACVSSQVGCPVGCVFCATGERGFVRNLEVREIVDQILTIQRDTALEVTNIVYMGQGEPLLNYDNVINSIKFVNEELEIGMRRITISTSGIIPQILKLADENRQLTLALSLHAPNHEIREKLIPVEKKYPLEEVVKALRQLTQKTGRRVTIEYVLIDGVNDAPEHAKEINYLLKGLNYNVNLIPYNSVNRDDFKAPSVKKVNIFKYILEQSGKKVTVRLERGSDILAACGQLSGKEV